MERLKEEDTNDGDEKEEEKGVAAWADRRWANGVEIGNSRSETGGDLEEHGRGFES